MSCFFFFNDTATTEIYTLSLHDALPICERGLGGFAAELAQPERGLDAHARIGIGGQHLAEWRDRFLVGDLTQRDRKSTRLNSSHLVISYAVFCLKKKN